MESVRYALVDYWEEYGDPRIEQYPLMSGGITTLLTIMATYVVLVKWILPEWMRHRAPYTLKTPIILYNIANIVFNLYFFVNVLIILDFGRDLFNFKLQPRDDWSPRALYRVRFVWLYYLCKLFDMLDTVFFVLRKKYSQVTFLHVYHHATVPFIVWTCIKLAPTSAPDKMFPLLNSIVHIVMYTYYLLASFGPQLQPYLWWKKYITAMQISQFVIFIIYGVAFTMLQENFPMAFMLSCNIQSPMFFVLFSQFYQKSYQQRKMKLKST